MNLSFLSPNLESERDLEAGQKQIGLRTLELRFGWPGSAANRHVRPFLFRSQGTQWGGFESFCSSHGTHFVKGWVACHLFDVRGHV
jgi:hypothetical protein